MTERWRVSGLLPTCSVPPARRLFGTFGLLQDPAEDLMKRYRQCHLQLNRHDLVCTCDKMQVNVLSIRTERRIDQLQGCGGIWPHEPALPLLA